LLNIHIKRNYICIKIIHFFYILIYYLIYEIGWKRFVFADSLRRILNIALFFSNLTNFVNNIYNDDKENPDHEVFIQKNTSHIFGLITSGFIISSWLMTGISLLVAFIIYLPLLSVIQGNLKEYCCHKIDKR